MGLLSDVVKGINHHSWIYFYNPTSALGRAGSRHENDSCLSALKCHYWLVAGRQGVYAQGHFYTENTTHLPIAGFISSSTIFLSLSCWWISGRESPFSALRTHSSWLLVLDWAQGRALEPSDISLYWKVGSSMSGFGFWSGNKTWSRREELTKGKGRGWGCKHGPRGSGEICTSEAILDSTW